LITGAILKSDFHCVSVYTFATYFIAATLFRSEKKEPMSKKPRESGIRNEYPRPQLVRNNWTSLNGSWDFAIDTHGSMTRPEMVSFGKQKIQVPFAPETPLSGVEDQSYFKAVWYRREIDTPELENGARLILHFGAVDFSARVWVNGQLAVEHEGGYTPFFADITDLLEPRKTQTIIVRADDDPHDLSKPRGKQDWKTDPHSIWYPRTTGIWQSVWMEVVGETRIGSLRWTTNVRRWEIDLHARIHGVEREKMRLRVRLQNRDRNLAEDEYSVSQGSVIRTISLHDPGIDDARNDLLWWPWAPNLIEAELELIDESGQTIDTVTSYTAMRSVAILSDRFVMNGRPLQLRLVLDQGYWLDGGLTAPSDDALRRDVELVKEMGFNGVRKHQKIEDPRFLYWADRLGLLVWEEMPSAYRFDDRTVRRVTREWVNAMERDHSHPCIVAWVPLNESWGVPDLPYSSQQRDFVRALYHMTKTLDPTRPVIGNDGWENIVTDIIAIHDYDGNLEQIKDRYTRSSENLFKLFTHERPGHKLLLLEGMKWEDIPVMLTEFGGIAFSKDVKHTWGYRRAGTAKQFQEMYANLLKTVRELPLFAGFCYTQFTDTYQEANGLLLMDRTPKFPLKQMSEATSGLAT
jgi:beta-galactosidase/beta-glucuronidase